MVPYYTTILIAPQPQAFQDARIDQNTYLNAEIHLRIVLQQRLNYCCTAVFRCNHQRRGSVLQHIMNMSGNKRQAFKIDENKKALT